MQCYQYSQGFKRSRLRDAAVDATVGSRLKNEYTEADSKCLSEFLNNEKHEYSQKPFEIPKPDINSLISSSAIADHVNSIQNVKDKSDQRRAFV